MFLAKLFPWLQSTCCSTVSTGPTGPTGPTGLRVNRLGHKFRRLPCDTLYDIIELERDAAGQQNNKRKAED